MHKHTGIAAALMAAIAIVVALLAPSIALADEHNADVYLDYEPTENPVADNVTRVLVNKLRADTHEYVEGAHLVIYPEADPTTIVAEWVSTGTSHEIARTLDVNTRYVLHEVSVPEGYGLAQDVTFELYSEDFNTTGTIIKGDYRLAADGSVEKDANGNSVRNAEFEIISGSGPEQAFVIALYDPIKPAQEQKEIRRQREVERPASYSGTTSLAKTGDMFNQPLVIALAACGLVMLALGIRRTRKNM